MDLETVDTDDLLTELQGRFDHSVFCGVKDATDAAEFVVRNWRGSKLKCLGLAQWINHRLLGAYHDDGYESDDEGSELDGE
jgi:hypothetical protein